MVSLKTIAEKCGVSTATVSKALNDQKDISEETKSRIRTVAEQLGYFPNAAARSLKTNHSYNLGVLFEEEAGRGLQDEYFSGVLNGLKVQGRSRVMTLHLSIPVLKTGRCLIWNIANTGILKELQLCVRILTTLVSWN